MNLNYIIKILTHNELLKLNKHNNQFIKFINEYYKEYVSNIRKRNIHTLLKYDKADYITYNNDYYCILCQYKNTFVGITFFIKNTHNIKLFSSLPKKYINYFYIYGTYITTSHRGKGINSLFLTSFYKNIQFGKLLTLIHNDNKASIKSYESNGFKPYNYKSPYDNTKWYIFIHSFYLSPLTDNSLFNHQIYSILIKKGLSYTQKLPAYFINLYENGVYDKNKINASNSFLISLLSGPSKYNITDKIKFTNIFQKSAFIYDSIIINKKYISNFEEPFIKIIKPDNGFSSKDIKIVVNNKEINDYLHSSNPKYNNFILQKYILKPDLFKSYKFNIRILLLVKLIHNKLTVFYTKYNYIKQSPSLYKPHDFNNPNIHLPIYISNEELLQKTNELFIYPTHKPDNFTDTDITQNYILIESYIKHIFTQEHNFKPAWGATCGFELFGIDVMFENKKPYFLEINEKIGTLNIFAAIIPNFSKSLIELTYLNKDTDKYHNFIKIHI